MEARTFSRWQWLGVAAVLLGTVAVLTVVVRDGERIYWIEHRADASWITVPQPPARAHAIRVERAQPPHFVFAQDFYLNARPDRAVLQLRALRELALRVNGEAVDLGGRDPRRWKRPFAVDVASLLRSGENRIEAEVVHREGPVLLQIWSDDLGRLVATRAGWRIREPRTDTAWSAVVAEDVRPCAPSGDLPVPAEVLRRRAPLLLAVFVLCALPACLGWRAPAWLGGEHWPRTAFAAVAVFWIALFVTKTSRFPNYVGFDAEGHNAYIDLLANERRLPRADEGWETFHPPLYHGATAALRLAARTEKGSPLDQGLVRLLPTLAGLACAWLSGQAALRLLPGASGVAALAVLVAGLLPVNLLLSSFASNETLHAAWLSGALVLSCGALCAARMGMPALWATSLLLGLALLTKSTTGLPIVVLLAMFVGAKARFVEARPWSAALGCAAIPCVGPVVLAGWFYLRNWQLFGDPFVSNLGSFAAWTYWMPPGFHTTDWYLGFGEVLRHPFFASFHSFADGFYGSFWGDGYASGRAGVKFPNPWWDYESMAAVIPLALPASGVWLLGLGLCATRALRGRDLGRRMAWSLLVLVAYGMTLLLLLTTLRIPFNAMPKAFYALPALVPLAIALAVGLAWLHARMGALGDVSRRVLRGVLSGYLGLLAFSIVAAFLR